MAIGRVSGPMLFSNLERQGVDLSIEGNLIYFDVNNLRVGINTSEPEYELHVTGPAGTTGNIFATGNIIGNSLVVHNAYRLTTSVGQSGQVLATDSQGGTYWTTLPTSVERKQFNYSEAVFGPGDTIEFDMDIGVSSIVYALTVNRPCLVEVFATPAKNETNPYTFLATDGHLVDDGTVLLSDGSVIQQRQYSIFANQESPPKPKVYAKITNTDGVSGPFDFSIIYFTSVTDSRTGIYEMNLVSALPASGYTGQTVLLTSTQKLHVWYNNQWNTIL